jgi:hypothetical protein
MNIIAGRSFLTASILCVATPALAQDVSVKPLAEARIRYEHDDQDDLAKGSDALVVRLRTGIQVSTGRWVALTEAQGTLAIVDDYHDGLHGPADRPTVYDPENVGLFRAQLQYRSNDMTMTGGRQRIALDDERFVGAGGWRINGQTYDAVRGEWAITPGLKLDLSYVRALRTFWGIEGTGARPQAIGGDSVLANLAWKTPIGTITGFAYLIDPDRASVQGFRLENQNYGVRVFGSQKLGGGVTAAYKASYARQSDYHRNPNNYAATYIQLDGTVTMGKVGANLGWERLGAARGTALTSFQFPFGSNFAFQGWADKFLTTPPDGLKDLYGGLSYGTKNVGPLDALTFQAVAHRFVSDRGRQHYGDELNLLATARIGRTAVSLRYADYWADRFASSTRKLWLQAEWTL